MKYLLLTILLATGVIIASDTNVIVITLTDDDIWAAQRQMARPTITRTNWPITTVSNYFATMLRRQINGFTAMELQQFQWEKRAKHDSAPLAIQLRVNDLLGITNPPPSSMVPPTP